MVLASGYSLQGRAKNIVDQGCKAFIKKPYSLFKLSETLRTALDEST